MSSFNRKAWAALALLFCTAFYGCGTPGAPQPPSLNLPDPVDDLSATRVGNVVTLTWTSPKRNTDRTTIKPDVKARVCRQEGTGACATVGSVNKVSPGEPDKFVESLNGSLATGAARPISYFVELVNGKGRSAGSSNAAIVAAGEVPRPIDGLQAVVRREGVVLSWAADGESAAVRLQRKVVSAPAGKVHEGPLTPVPEPTEQSFLVDTPGQEPRAIDKTVRFGEKYEYRVQRISSVETGGKKLELAGALSAPVDVDVEDVFPPAVPKGLAAVATAGESGTAPSIDLNWEPDTGPSLAGYIVYRREDDGEWKRISPASPIIEPAFHDTQVQPGHTYRYAVSAVSKGGQESGRSEEAEERVPEP
jgi:hypothetical protein